MIASLVWPFNTSANGVGGTVAGTVINTLFYNSGEAADVMSESTVNFDMFIEWSTETTCGLDPLIGGSTSGWLGTCKVHSEGCGLTAACLCMCTESAWLGW